MFLEYCQSNLFHILLINVMYVCMSVSPWKLLPLSYYIGLKMRFEGCWEGEEGQKGWQSWNARIVKNNRDLFWLRLLDILKVMLVSHKWGKWWLIETIRSLKVREAILSHQYPNLPPWPPQTAKIKKYLRKRPILIDRFCHRAIELAAFDFSWMHA